MSWGMSGYLKGCWTICQNCFLLHHYHFFIVYSLTSQPHFLFLNQHFRHVNEYRHRAHSYIKVSVFLLMFYDAHSLRPVSHLPDLIWIIFWPGNRPILWHVCILCLYLILHSGHSRVIHSCIVLLWFYAESFVIATANTMPTIIAISWFMSMCMYGP